MRRDSRPQSPSRNVALVQDSVRLGSANVMFRIVLILLGLVCVMGYNQGAVLWDEYLRKFYGLVSLLNIYPRTRDIKPADVFSLVSIRCISSRVHKDGAGIVRISDRPL